jgi:hypothetical protein
MNREGSYGVRQRNWGVDLLNSVFEIILCFFPFKTLDKIVSDFYIYLEIGVRFFNQGLIVLNQFVNKNTKIPFGIFTPNENLSSKKFIAYEKQLLV